ncbi:MAG TPA: hypothetical protein VJN95_07815 [Gemmatimonadales bacterium]|nr:hypothetical protein [Gemmatimonadales bacterium]
MWTEPVAFLDGTQRLDLFANADGADSLYYAEVAAGVSRRVERRLTSVLRQRRELIIGRGASLERIGEAGGGCLLIPLPEDVGPHPIRDKLLAGKIVDQQRGQLEVAVGRAWREQDRGWLIVDGSLAQSPAWAGDERMLGVVKSHSALPFEGDDLNRYLRLPARHRTSVFSVEAPFAQVYSWALRLWPWEGKDLLYGLIRVEAAPTEGTLERVDQLSRYLLAERAPISAPDPRWDRMMYGIRGVELALKGAGSRERGAGTSREQ